MRRCGQCDKVIVIGINTAPTGKVRFDRVHSPRSEWELWRWERDYLRITDEIMRSVESGEWYRNTTSCYDYFTPCMYSDICTFDIPEDRWGDYFKVEGEE